MCTYSDIIMQCLTEEAVDFVRHLENQTIKEMHQMFILKQEFWLKEAKRLVDKDPITED